MPGVDKVRVLIQRGGRLLLLGDDGKRLERLVVPTLISPLPGLWSVTENGDRLFLVDGGVDNTVYLSTGIRVCVVDIASGRQRLLFNDRTLRDHLGRPVTEIEGATGNGLADWQLLSMRLLPGERVLYISLSHPIHGNAVCALDSRTCAAVVMQVGIWKRMGTATYIDERAGVMASVERDAINVPLVVTTKDPDARLVIGVPAGAVGKFSEVAVSPDGKIVAAVLAGSAIYAIDMVRRTSRKVGSGTYVAPHWNSAKSVMAIKQGMTGQKTGLVEINVETLRERTIVQDVDGFLVISRRRSNWKIKSTP
jgi:hypothetical protein